MRKIIIFLLVCLFNSNLHAENTDVDNIPEIITDDQVERDSDILGDYRKLAIQ